MKLLALLFVLVSISGCATYKPVPEGYTGPTATIVDTGFAEGGAKAQMFVVLEVDGNRILNSLAETASASYGRGFALIPRFVSRQVPVKPMKLTLRATHVTGAPIHAIFSQAAGTFFSVEGTVDFTPAPEGRYVVRGELKKDESAVWIADAATNEPVTQKVFGK